MSDLLSRLVPPPGSRHSEKRVGRGVGSRLGKTCGRGQKGQKARQGGNIGKLYFQGGQMPIQRRLPKRGFRNPFPTKVVAINVADLERFEAGSIVDEAALRAARLVQGRDVVIKLLGDGDLSKALTVHVHRASKTAQEKVAAAGGKLVLTESESSEQQAEAPAAEAGA